MRKRPFAWLAAVLAVVAGAWASWLAAGLTLRDATEAYLLTNSAVAVTFTAFGALVLAYRRGHRIGWLFAGLGGCYTTSVAGLGLRSGLVPWTPAVERAIDLVGITAWIPAVTGCLPLILQTFPDGRPLTSRWRWLAIATLALTVTAPALAFAPGGMEHEPIADRSPVLPDAAGRVVAAVLPVLGVAAALVLALSLLVLVLRARRSTGSERLQVLWLLWAVGVFVVLNAQRVVGTDGPVLFLLTLPLVPAAATVAIVRHQLYDIRLIINRSLVYALLSVGVVGGYLTVVAVLAALVRDRMTVAPVLATAVVAVAFAPARSGAQALVDRLMYGRRRDPAEAAARVGARLGGGLDGVLAAVAETLRLPYAAIVAGDRVLAASGAAPPARENVPLELAGAPAAELVIGLRPGETRLAAADRRALRLLAAPVGLAVQSVRLSEQLGESRARIVSAREEERRRLRRDLHDGLGTALTAVSLKADAAYNVRAADPERSAALLLGLRADLTGAITDIRRLVYDLRPPDLDELGLVGALRQRAEQNPSCLVSIDADELPPLPAAVEVAAYRIATEAVTNAVRHGRPSRCQVVLRADDELHLEIRDDSPAAADRPWRHGVGLRSMHERAGELGGTLTAGPTGHGGLVHARLPLDPA